MTNLLKNLNSEQKRAVIHKEGPLLIIAGAGTGKTKVITTRIAHLIEKGYAKPNEILALTFTDKAAREMEERVDILLPIGVVDSYISTFHAFGDRILREHATTFGINPDYRLLKKSEQVLFLRDNLFRFDLKILRPPTNPTKFVEIMLRVFSRAKDENISPKEYITWAKNKIRKIKDKTEKRKAMIQLEIAKSYETYQKLMRERNYLDYGDQIFLLLHGLKQNPGLLNDLRQKFKYILVDEYQDTNYIQNELIKLLAHPKNNITVVGDDDQSIYKFRGAAISNIIKFVEDFPKTKKVVLIKNYRSGQKILDTSYTLIKNNNPDRLEATSKINKKLKSTKRIKGRVEYLAFETESTEADKIAEIIEKKVKRGKSYKDIAVLLRANSQAQAIIRALNYKGIPTQFSGDTLLYRREEVQMLINFLRVLTTNRDSLSLYSLAISSIYNLDINDLVEIFDICRRQNQTLFHALKNIKNLNPYNPISEETAAKAQNLIKDIEDYREMSRLKSPGVILYQFLADKKILSELRELEDTPENEIKIKNIAGFFREMRTFEDIVRKSNLIHLTEYLDSILEAGVSPEEKESDPDIDAVNIMTVHAAKGLEFDVVFVAGLVEGKFPAMRRSESIDIPEKFIKEILPKGDFHIEEERRLFYVAMTRAKSELYLTNALDYGGERARRASPFVGEALGKKVVLENERNKEKRIEQIELFREVSGPKIKIKKSQNLRLSFRQVDDYITCPLKYKYSSIMRLPVMQHFAVAFGNAIHTTISYFLQQKKMNRKIYFEDVFARFKNSWRNEGFLSRDHQKEAFEKGKRMLRVFYQKEKNKPAPKEIESSFSIKVGEDTIIGRIDAIYREEGKDKIYDFKSSEVDSPEKAKESAGRSLQLSIYALAYKEIHGELPESIGLYFLGSGVIGESKPTERRLETAKNNIQKAREGIISGDFEPKPSKFSCTYCAYSKICPYSEA